MTDPTAPERGRAHEDEKLDQVLEMTFPASDPLPWIRDHAARELYLDDLKVGDVFRSGSMTVSEDAIKTFASHFDPQPFHLDPQAATASPFGGLAASGWHTAAISMRLIVDGGLKIAGGVLGFGGQISWPRATRPGDVLTVQSEILEVTPSRSNPSRGAVTVRNITLNQRNEAVQVTEVKLLVPRRDAAG